MKSLMKVPHHVLLSRRPAATLLAAMLVPPRAVPASDESAVTKITSKIGNGEPVSIDIGLYGEAAPESVALFRGLCGSGDLPPELRYRSSTCTRIEQGKSIVCGRLSAGSAARIDREIDATGYVRSSLVSLADQYTTSDANALSHDRAGLVSMKKGGGQFEFVVTPAANPALDETNVVIGEVIQGMDVLQELDSVPARRPSKDSEVGGLVWALGAYDEGRYLSVAKAGGDPRARIDTNYRPLQKVKITDATLLR